MAFPVNEGNIHSLREFLTQYNKLTESCFNKCVLSLNDRKIDKEENACVECCIDRFVRFNQRAMATFADAQVQKRKQQMEEVEAEVKKVQDEQMKQQQQQQVSHQTPQDHGGRNTRSNGVRPSHECRL